MSYVLKSHRRNFLCGKEGRVLDRGNSMDKSKEAGKGSINLSVSQWEKQ